MATKIICGNMRHFNFLLHPTTDNGMAAKMIKIVFQRLLIIASLAGITACGGGGGSGGGSSGGTTSTPAASLISVVSSSSLASLTSTPAASLTSVVSSSSLASLTSTPSSSATSAFLASSSVTSSAQSALTNLSPSARIQFPRKDAFLINHSHQIEVAGVAYDDKGIKSVKVNGVLASLNVSSSIAPSTDIPATHSHATNWSATITLPSGDTQIEVVITDSDDLVVKNAANPLTIRNSYRPSGMFIDVINDLMIGSNIFGESVATNLQTLASVTFPSADYREGVAFNKAATAIYSARVVDGFLKVYSNKIMTGVDSLVANYDLQLDPEIYNWAYMTSGTLSRDEKFYFVTLMYVLRNIPVESKVLKIDTGSGVVSVLAGKEIQPTYKNIGGIFYADNYLLGLHFDNYYNSELIKIDAETGMQTEFLTLPRFDLFTLNSDGTRLYGITYDKFVAINLSDKTVVSKSFAAQGNEFALTLLSRLVVDEKRNRLIVSSPEVSDVIAVDIATGERSLLIKNGIGTGASLVAPEQLEVTSDDKFAYVLDGRDRAPDTLFKIDLATGNRTVVADFNAYNDIGTAGLALDELNHRIFFALGLTIGVVDLDSGAYQIIASSDVGLGVTMETLNSISEIIYDGKNNRLLVSSVYKDFVLAIDPITFKRSVLFDSTIGTGATLKGIAAMTLDNEGKNLYLSNVNGDSTVSILSINMETGDRKFVLDRCVSKNGFSHTIDSYMNALEWDNQKNRLFISDYNEILVQDIANNHCDINYSSATDIALLSDSTLLGLSSGLVQINPANGMSAILSK